MAGTKCVVYENICQRSQFFAEVFFIFCFFFAITCVFQQYHIAVFHFCYSFFRIFANYVIVFCEYNFFAQQFGQTFCYRCQRQFRLGFALGFAHVRAKDYFAAVFHQFFNGRQCCCDSVFISDHTIFQRYVEITSYQNAFALYFQIIYCFFL